MKIVTQPLAKVLFESYATLNVKRSNDDDDDSPRRVSNLFGQVKLYSVWGQFKKSLVQMASAEYR